MAKWLTKELLADYRNAKKYALDDIRGQSVAVGGVHVEINKRDVFNVDLPDNTIGELSFVMADMIGMHTDSLGPRTKYTLMRVLEVPKRVGLFTYRSGIVDIQPGGVYQFKHEDPHGLVNMNEGGYFHRERMQDLLFMIARKMKKDVDVAVAASHLMSPSLNIQRKPKVVFGCIAVTTSKKFDAEGVQYI